ncbi:MAG TPA: hypothetical protein VJT09_19425 [Pyrinomonadaceae bacterium]|nr:hypothetical protein [Pyrinomonadaceae bacterium]
MRPVVKQLDHLIARKEADARPLFELLTGTLGLPVAWPFRSYPSFTSGGVALGNLYLEVLSCAPRRDASARFAALAFEADLLEDSVRELDGRGIPRGPATSYVQREANGSKTKLYANAILGKMLGRSFWIDYMIMLGRLPGASKMADPGRGGWAIRFGLDKVMNGHLVFLVEYAYGHFKDLPHWSEFKTHEEKRSADKASLQACGGGALGVESVKEVWAKVRSAPWAQKRWAKFLGPEAETSPGLWEIADGPAVRLVQSSESGISTLVLKVASRQRAETFLSEQGMLGAIEEGWSSIAPEKIYRLDVRLVE